jgi:diguanylate cyclase (GGDEF)-like protein
MRARPIRGFRRDTSTTENATVTEDGDISRDPLTGLHNRRRFTEALEVQVARAHRDDGRLTLALVDIDNFKKVNDEVGHIGGDAILRALAARFQSVLRPDELAWRIGGDEFALLLPDSSAMEAAQRLELLKRNLATSPVWPKGVTLSYGVAQLAHNGEKTAELLARADVSLYDKKQEPPAAGSGVREPRRPKPSSGGASAVRSRGDHQPQETAELHSPLLHGRWHGASCLVLGGLAGGASRPDRGRGVRQRGMGTSGCRIEER